MSRSGRKHERIHQCSRCTVFDRVDSWCVDGGKDIQEPEKLIYCSGFKTLKKNKPKETD